MRILGVDPGSRLTGWGIVEHHRKNSTHLASGTLNLNAKLDLAERLVILSNGLNEIVREYSPEQAALEQIFASRYARSALVLGHARGVILCELARAGLPLFEYSATQVKQSVVGGGRASKEQVNKMVSLLLGRTNILQEDEADALAVALTHATALQLGVLG